MEENKKIQCKNCKGWYTLFMSHLKKKTDCQKAYGEGYERMLELKAQKKKDYLEDYREENKHQLREQNAEYRATNKNAIDQKRAANKDTINQKRAENKDKFNEKRRSQRNLDRKKRNMKEREYPYYQQKKIKLSRTSNDRILAFKRQIIDGPNFTCDSCKACLFKGQVKILKANAISNLKAKLDKNGQRHRFNKFYDYELY